MERGIYFDGWYRNNHCYHPSMPIRSMQMIEDIERYRGTLLVWSAMGGGSISLPFIEHEAYGEVDSRLRFYGFMNDSEFIAECNKRGIKVFGIIFEVQGWEFPAQFSEDSKSFKSLNVMHDDQPHDWYGLREFTSDKHWEVFGKKLKDYYPEGLYNSNGEEVKDIMEECCARDYYNVPVHSEWVEVVGHEQIAYQMCRNNPVWRGYLGKIMEIQIDAGVAGIQLDECELPMTSIRYGGCFCKDCMKQFNEYLQELKIKGQLSEGLMDVDLSTFHYGDYLRVRNIPYPGNIEDIPYYKHYWDYQLRAIKKHFLELVNSAKKYAKSKGKDVLISGNFFNLMPSYYPLETGVDVIITEMKQTLFKQPHWYRYAAGFAGDKTIIVAENPYGGVVPELVEMLDDGKGYDLYRIFLLEASVYGCNMAVPYGAWMGNTIKTGLHPPREVTEEVQSFLASNEKLYSKKSGSNILVLYSFPSYYWREAAAGYSESILDDAAADGGILSYSVIDFDDPNSPRLLFWEIIKQLSDKQINYDVKLMADGDLRSDEFDRTDLEGYELIVLPDCNILTENQATVLEAYAKNEHKLVIFGRAGENLSGWADRMKKMENVMYSQNDDYKPKAMENFEKAFNYAYKDIWQVQVDNSEIGLQIHQLENGIAIHLLNYAFSEERDCVGIIPLLSLKVNQSFEQHNILIHSLTGQDIGYDVCIDEIGLTIRLHDVPLYIVVEIVK